jgi:folylpolyglutamate synthase/dihydropteroate synthase
MKHEVPALVGLGTPVSLLQDIAGNVGAVFNRVDEILSAAISKNSFPFLFKDQIKVLTSEIEEINDVIVDTDGINKDLALASLCILHDRYESFSSISSSIYADKIMEASSSRPPCRWEIHSVTVDLDDGSKSTIRVVFDVGHNPAAVSALARRIKQDFSKNPVR